MPLIIYPKNAPGAALLIQGEQIIKREWRRRFFIFDRLKTVKAINGHNMIFRVSQVGAIEHRPLAEHEQMMEARKKAEEQQNQAGKIVRPTLIPPRIR